MSLPHIPPKVEIETKAIIKQCIKSRAALAELKQAAKLIPNQSILINTLPLLEAGASSEIENIITTTDKLFKYAQSEGNADPATKEVLRYSHALFEGFRALEKHPLNTRTVEAICSQIKGVEMSVRRVPGATLTNQTTGKIIYMPPVGEKLLRDLLSNWEQFLHDKTTIDPLIRMAIGHYQFEAIHPFIDGNGRTGRVVNSLFLIQEETSIWTTAKITAIQELAEHTIKYVQTKAPKIYSYELVNLIFELPYCRINSLTEAGIAKRQTASQYLKQLVEIGVLAECTVSKEKLFAHPKLMKLLVEDSNVFSQY